MDASIKESVKASDKEAQYDEKAKKLLRHKIILAYILVNTVEEFRGMNPKDVVKYIEGEPYISTVPIDSGMTNTKERKEESIEEIETTEQVIGLNTENSEINEGMIRFDIIFYVRMKDGLTQIIVNIEAQKEEPGKYYILNRAIFYIGRIVSSQKGRDFVKSEYKSNLEVEEKLDIMEKEYDVPIEEDIREEVEEMCNLSQGIKEKAFEGGYLMGQEEGRESGYAEGKQNGYAEAVCLMYESGLSIEQIK